VNGEGAIVVSVTSAIGDRTLDRVIRLVADAETQKAPTQQFTDRFERIFVPVVLIGAALMILLPPLALNWPWSKSFYRAMALLVAASPCALALGTPAAVLAGIAQAARKGVLIKGGAHLESLGSITRLALDKTGTITKGEPSVTDILVMQGVTEEEILTAAASVEQRSQHPLAVAVMKEAEARKITVPAAGDLESVTGQGVRAVVAGSVVSVGRLLMFSGSSSFVIPEAISDMVEKLETNGRTTMVVHRAAGGASSDERSSGAQWLGVVGIADEPRPDVVKTLDALRASGIREIVMLTGDNPGVGAAIGKEVGIQDVRAGLMPEDKVTAIKELALKGPVAMVGDGVNDAPALAYATVGIAMGGAGTAAALETADVALMGDDLSRLPFAIGLSRRARSVIKQNLYLSLGMIAFLVLATTTGFLGIAPTVVLHEGSTLVVIVNALRLLTYRGPASPRDGHESRYRPNSRG
jgi:Cd2+/Zn2+-exporting ATPase